MGHAESAVQMLVHDDVATGEGAAPAYPVEVRQLEMQSNVQDV